MYDEEGYEKLVQERRKGVDFVVDDGMNESINYIVINIEFMLNQL